MNDGKRQVADETEPDENPIATIHYENGTELTGKAVTLQDGTVGVRIPGEFFKTALRPDGSMPDGVLSVDIGPKHVEGGLPLTDDMACMAVTAMLRDAVGLTSGEASDAYEAWLNRLKKVLDIDYDNGYGSQEIAADLVVVFTDGGFLRREEYDGSEWWEYEPPFRGPETQKPFGRVKRTYPAYSLEDINYPMEATEE